MTLQNLELFCCCTRYAGCDAGLHAISAHSQRSWLLARAGKLALQQKRLISTPAVPAAHMTIEQSISPVVAAGPTAHQAGSPIVATGKSAESNSGLLKEQKEAPQRWAASRSVRPAPTTPSLSPARPPPTGAPRASPRGPAPAPRRQASAASLQAAITTDLLRQCLLELHHLGRR